MNERHRGTERRGSGHLTVYLAWPVLSGLFLAGVLSVSVGGLVWLFTDWHTAYLWAGAVGLGTLGLATLIVFTYAAGEFAGPRTIATMRQTTIVEEVELPEPEPRFIRVGGRPLALNAPAPSSGVNRGILRAAIDHLASGLKRRSTVHTLATDVENLEPAAPAWVVEFYQVVCKVWPAGSLSRRTFEGLWPGGEGKRLWAKYVNGDDTGRRAGRGILHTWGVIDQTGPRGSWVWCQPLDVIFNLDRDLQAYADAKSKLHSPTQLASPLVSGMGADQTRPDQTSQTRPDGQTMTTRSREE